ncbi:MAG: hypothetical protein R6W75_13800 [Smithellaceae bacterium]
MARTMFRGGMSAYFTAGLCVCLLLSCTPFRMVKFDTPEDITKDGPLRASYVKLIIHDFDSDPDIEKKDPGTAASCGAATLNELLTIGAIAQIEKAKSRTLRQESALILKAYITEGKTPKKDLSADIRLIDAFTGKTVRTKYLSTADRPPGKAQAKDKATQSICDELGQMIARYISETMAGN